MIRVRIHKRRACSLLVMEQEHKCVYSLRLLPGAAARSTRRVSTVFEPHKLAFESGYAATSCRTLDKKQIYTLPQTQVANHNADHSMLQA